jgi:hypothetical protein
VAGNTWHEEPTAPGATQHHHSVQPHQPRHNSASNSTRGRSEPTIPGPAAANTPAAPVTYELCLQQQRDSRFTVRLADCVEQGALQCSSQESGAYDIDISSLLSVLPADTRCAGADGAKRSTLRVARLPPLSRCQPPVSHTQAELPFPTCV